MKGLSFSACEWLVGAAASSGNPGLRGAVRVRLLDLEGDAGGDR